jgi:threonine dehydratase
MLHGIRTLLFEEHLVAEPAGAAALAAFLQNQSAYAGRKVVLIVSGANIPHELLRRAVISSGA